MKKEKFIRILQSRFPDAYAEPWDNTGLIIDSGNVECERVMIALEMTTEVLGEAVELGVDLVVTHHPVIFSPIRKLTGRYAEDRMVMDCIKNGISVYSIHTNCDNFKGGTNDFLANLIGLEEVRPIEPAGSNYLKLAVFSPAESAEAIRSKMGEMGGGNIGMYSHCTFASAGEGTFRPKDGANPYLGRIGETERVGETKIETIVSHSIVASMVEEIKRIHPYEEMAYDIIQLANTEKGIGGGRIGRLRKPQSMKMLLGTLKRELSAEGLRYYGDQDCIVEWIGLCTGSGSEFIRKAFDEGADCFLTGDIKYHDAQFARMNGLSIVDVGHYESENIYKNALVDIIEEELRGEEFACQVFPSNIDINPFRFYA